MGQLEAPNGYLPTRLQNIRTLRNLSARASCAVTSYLVLTLNHILRRKPCSPRSFAVNWAVLSPPKSPRRPSWSVLFFQGPEVLVLTRSFSLRNPAVQARVSTLLSTSTPSCPKVPLQFQLYAASRPGFSMAGTRLEPPSSG